MRLVRRCPAPVLYLDGHPSYHCHLVQSVQLDCPLNFLLLLDDGDGTYSTQGVDGVTGVLIGTAADVLIINEAELRFAADIDLDGDIADVVIA